MRTLLALAAAILLSGCWWIGPPFYRADPTAAAPISAGRWAATEADGTVKEHRLVRYPDGGFGPAPGEQQDKQRITFHPLAVAGRDLWITQLTSTDPRSHDAAYGLAERRGDTVDLLPLIDCEGNEALARAAGGTVKVVPESQTAPPHGDGMLDPRSVGTTCLFASAAALERAMTAWVARNPRLEGAVQLHRVGD